MQDAEDAVRAIEDFYERFRFSTPAGRKLELPRLPALRSRLVGVCNDGYVMGKLSSFEEVCKRLSRLRQPSGFDESREISLGLGDIGVIRSWMAHLELVNESRQRE